MDVSLPLLASGTLVNRASLRLRLRRATETGGTGNHHKAESKPFRPSCQESRTIAHNGRTYQVQTRFTRVRWLVPSLYITYHSPSHLGTKILAKLTDSAVSVAQTICMCHAQLAWLGAVMTP